MLNSANEPRITTEARTILILALTLSLLMMHVQNVMADQAYTITKVQITVYRDGVAHVEYTISVNETASSVSIPLLGSPVNVMVQDDTGQLLQFDLTQQNIVVYSLDSPKFLLEYDTATLTSKDGAAWTLKLSLPTQSKIILPEDSSIIYLSDRPTLIEAAANRPILTLTNGAWEISYVISIKITTARTSLTSITTTTSRTTTSPPPPSLPLNPAAILAASALTVALCVAFLIIRKRRSDDLAGTLSNMDTEVLNLIRSRGGRIFESELRDLLVIPKTSAWRRVKRLEKMGLVRTKKIGSQNQIELT